MLQPLPAGILQGHRHLINKLHPYRTARQPIISDKIDLGVSKKCLHLILRMREVSVVFLTCLRRANFLTVPYEVTGDPPTSTLPGCHLLPLHKQHSKLQPSPRFASLRSPRSLLRTFGPSLLVSSSVTGRVHILHALAQEPPSPERLPRFPQSGLDSLGTISPAVGLYVLDSDIPGIAT